MEPIVTTKKGDSGLTNLGIYGMVKKYDERINLIGELDHLLSYSFYLEDCPKDIRDCLVSMMIGITTNKELDLENEIKKLENNMLGMKDGVSFTDKGWSYPTNNEAKSWNMFRVYVREAERNAWKLDMKLQGILLNRLSDYCFLKTMQFSQKKCDSY